MDETGHSGDTGSAESGSGGESRERPPLNGWATSDGPWSNAGAALDPEEDVPAWRRPLTEVRPFTRQPAVPEDPPGDARPPRSSDGGRFDGRGPADLDGRGPAWSSGRARYSDLLAHLSPNGHRPSPSAALPPSFQPGPVPIGPDETGPLQTGPLQTGPSQIGPSQIGPAQIGPAQTGPTQVGPAQNGAAQAGPTSAAHKPNGQRPDPFAPELLNPESAAQRPDPRLGGSLRARGNPLFPQRPDPLFPPRPPRPDPLPRRPDPLLSQRPDSLQSDDQRRSSDLRAIDATPPSSAPPYPYEGDLDDAARGPAPQQRAAVPLSRPFPAVRPATPGGRRADWISSESARHALEPSTPTGDLPRIEPNAGTEDKRSSVEPNPARPSYDPSSFPRRLPYEPAAPAGPAPSVDNSAGYAPPTAYPGLSGRSAGDPGFGPAEPKSRALPQRVPAEPDVPTVPEPPSVEPPAETPALARIATHLRRGDVLSAQERQEGFDVNAILEAVKEVAGVRDASLRSTPAGAHSLRLDLAEGADPAEVSRQVARLLQDRMGLDAAMQGSLDPAPRAAPPPRAFVPAPTTPASRGPAGTVPAGTVPTLPTSRAPLTRAPVSGGPVGGVPVSGGPTGGAPVSGGPTGALPAVAAPAAEPSTVDLARTLPQAGRPTAGAVTDRPEVNGPTRPLPARPYSTLETVPSPIDHAPPRPLEVGEQPGPRVVIENVQVNTFGTEATVEVRLAVGPRTASGVATGPAVDGYLLRLCAMATGQAVDELLSTSDHVDPPARCFVEHASAVSFGPMRVAVVVLLLSCGSWVEQLAGSAVVTGDDRHAMVRATLAAVNRRLEALLS